MKNIHQIWFQGADQVPEKYHNNIRKSKEINSDWNYKLWDDKSLQEECLKYSKECYNRYISFPHMHQKIDFGRYVVLHNNGGISLDMDASAIKSFNEIPKLDQNKMIVCKLNMSPVESLVYCQKLSSVNNAHIYSPQYNKSIRKVIDGIIKQKPIMSINKELDILRTTGPLNFSKLVDDDVIKLNYYYFEPNTLGDTNIDDKTIILHQTDGTWLNENFQLLYTLYKYIKQNFMFIMIVIILLIIAINYVKSL